MKVRYVVAAIAGCAMMFAAPAQAAFSDWAAIVVAGDNHAHDGGPSEVFDNGRRDVAAALTQMGFARDNVAQFSVDPDRHKGTIATSQGEISQTLWALS